MSDQNQHKMKVIARIRAPFKTKFGIPRQSGLTEVKSQIVMEPSYRNPDAFRGIEGFTHLWLIWQFSESVREDWSPTVRPPRLGGNQRMGVFATRSPFRPNAIGLSSVKIEAVTLNSADGPIITVSGADLLDGTPIYDIKPYLPFTDSHPEAIGGFADLVREDRLQVVVPNELCKSISDEQLDVLLNILRSDPRPSYHNDPTRTYGFLFENLEIRFQVQEQILTVVSILPIA